MSHTAARQLASRTNALAAVTAPPLAGLNAPWHQALQTSLTGLGVVIPGEDPREVAHRVDALQAELAPEGSILGRLLSRRVAMLTVRSERSIRHEAAMTADRVRNAGDDFDEARRAEADHLLSHIGQEPATYHRRLLAMPEGIDLLLHTFRVFRDCATPGPTLLWTDQLAISFDLCTGRRPGSAPESRVRALTRAIDGNWDQIDPLDGAGLTPQERVHWAIRAIAALIDAEIARLEALRPTLDLARIAASRAEAGERALVDTGPAATLARKYEAATERAIFQTLREIRALRKDQRTPVATLDRIATTREADSAELPELNELDTPALGSFFPGGDPAPRPPRGAANPVLPRAAEPPRPGSRGRHRPKLNA